MNNFQRATVLALIAVCFAYCAEKPSKIKTYDAGIALAVEKDVLTFAIERRLAELERVTVSPARKTVRSSIQTPTSLDPVHDGQNPPQ